MKTKKKKNIQIRKQNRKNLCRKFFDKASIRKNLCRKINFFGAPILQTFMSHTFIPALIYAFNNINRNVLLHNA